MSSPEPSDGCASDAVADLVARVILALECDGRAAAEALLVREPDLADAARARIQSLREAGMLRDPDDAPPARIGPYRVLERLGRGGMGEVFLAEQREPVQRRVALKVIRAGMDSREVLARFAVERQALALFDHPNIAKVFDAGMTADSRPYLAMEYVSGTPITKYCDERGLDTEQRVRLFAEVCETIQHAHQRGILHRDLKPSNILVTDRDGMPWPKVIDFGVAKSTQLRLGEQTLYTEVGRVLGTPEYMSPEQAQNRVDLDTRTDVFSLGVILYELLTGSLPIESTRLRTVGQGEMERILLAEDPPTPSTKISTLGESAAEVASRRRTDPGTLRRRLRGDLDWITMKALERDRNRRYASADALAADLRRHLVFEPVTAGPPGAWYRLTRFARRHRNTTVAATTIVLAMLIGLVTSVSFWREARAAQISEAKARAEAEDAFDTAIRAADEILVEVGGDRLRRFPGLADERQRLLERGLTFCRSVVSRVPAGSRHWSSAGLVQSRIAWFLTELGLESEALAALASTVVPDGDGEDVHALRLAIGQVRGSAFEKLGDLEQAVVARRTAVEAARRLVALGPEDINRSDLLTIALGRLAHALKSADAKGAEAKAAYDEASGRVLARLDQGVAVTTELPDLLHVLADQANWLVESGEPARAQGVSTRLESSLRELLEKHPNDARLREQLAPTLELRAHALMMTGEFVGAEKDSREAIAIRERLVSEFPGDQTLSVALAVSKATLADSLVHGFRYREALELLRDVVAIRERQLAASPDSTAAKIELAWTFGELTQATVDFRKLKLDVPLDEVIAAMARAKELVDGLIGRNDLGARGEQLVNQYYFSSAGLEEARGNLEVASEFYLRSVEWSDLAIARRPDVVTLRISLHAALRAAGRVRALLGDFDDAKRLLRRSVDGEEQLRARGVSYLGSTSRQRDVLILLAQTCVRAKDPLGAEEAATRAIATDPNTQIVNRQASEIYLAAARDLDDPTDRARVLQLALDTATKARDCLVEQHSGNDSISGASYRITEFDVLSQIAAVRSARGEAEACDQLCEQAIGIAQGLVKDFGRDRDKARLETAYGRAIAYRNARGDTVGAEELTTRRDDDLRGGR